MKCSACVSLYGEKEAKEATMTAPGVLGTDIYYCAFHAAEQPTRAWKDIKPEPKTHNNSRAKIVTDPDMKTTGVRILAGKNAGQTMKISHLGEPKITGQPGFQTSTPMGSGKYDDFIQPITPQETPYIVANTEDYEKLIYKLRKAKKKIRLLKATIKNKENTIKEYKKGLEATEEDIVNNWTHNDDIDEKIEVLRDEIELHKEALQEYQEVEAEKDKQIEDLKCALEGFEATVEHKSKLIEELEAKSEVWKTKADFEKRMRALLLQNRIMIGTGGASWIPIKYELSNKYIDAWNKSKEAWAERSCKSQLITEATNQELRERIQQQEKEISRMMSAADRMTNDVVVTTNENNALQAEIREKDRTINNLRAIAADRKQKEWVERTIIKETEAEIRELKSQIYDRDQEIWKLKNPGEPKKKGLFTFPWRNW